MLGARLRPGAIRILLNDFGIFRFVESVWRVLVIRFVVEVWWLWYFVIRVWCEDRAIRAELVR